MCIFVAAACMLALMGMSGYAIAAPAIVTSPAAIAVDGQGGFEELEIPKGVTTVVIGSSTYALVAAYDDDGLQIIDMTDPFNPVPVASVTDGQGGFEELDGARYVTTVAIGSSTYALVAASADHGVQIVDIANPADPAPAGHIGGAAGALIRDTRGIATVTAGTSTYALVASHAGHVRVFDITDPSRSVHVSSMDGGTGGFGELFQPRGVTAVTIGSSTYALVALYGSGKLLIANVTDPLRPAHVATVDNDQNSRLGGATAVTAVTIGSSTYALVAAQTDNAFQIIDITDPSSPEPVAFAQDGHGGFDHLDYPESIATVTFGSSTYAVVAAFLDGIQIIDITDPSRPVPAASVSHYDDRFGGFALPEDITAASIGSRTYVLAAANLGNSVPIIEVALTSGPRLVSSDLDEGTGILRMAFSGGIDVTPASRVDLSGMTIRHSGQSVPLEGAYLETEGDSEVVSIRLTEGQARAVAAMESPRLDLADSAVVDASGNAIYRTYGNAITVTDEAAPEVVSAILDGEAGVLRITFSDRVDVTPSWMVYQTDIVIRDSAQSVPLAGAHLDTGADSAEISLRLTGEQRRMVSAMSSLVLDVGYYAVADTAGNPIAQSSGHPVVLGGANEAPSAGRP